ncbi:DUF4832 domain-containing protein [Novipirellula artificiosorum]
MENWKQHPIGGEIRPEVWGCVFDSPSCAPEGQAFADCVNETHATWLMDTGMFRETAAKPRYQRAIEQVGRMGYEFHLAAAKVDAAELQETRVSVKVENRGVAPFYHKGWKVQLGLIDPVQGEVIEQWPTSWRLTGIQPGEGPTTWSTTLNLKAIAAGDYVVALSVPSNIKGGVSLRFANQTQDNDAKDWVSIGSLRIQP